MDNREYARQEKLNRIDEQSNCGSHPSAHLWQDAYRETMSTLAKEQKSSQQALRAVGNYIKEEPADTRVQAMLGIGGAAFAITAVAVESPVIIGAASLGAVACGGAFIWSGANSAMKHYTGKDLHGQ
jgi:hypothetical protein